MVNREDFDIMGNIKLIENYKSFLLSSVADLYSTMTQGNKASMETITDEISEIVIFSYLLGDKLGVNYSSIDDRLLKKLKLALLDENIMEKENHDYSKLISYIKDAREF